MKLKSSIIAMIALSSVGFAGGDIGGITTFENNDIVSAEVEAVAPAPIETIAEPIVEATPIETMPEPVIETAPEPIVEATPIETMPEPVVEATPIETAPEPIVEATPVETMPEPVVEATPVETAPEPVVEATPIETTPEPIVDNTPIVDTTPVETTPIVTKEVKKEKVVTEEPSPSLGLDGLYVGVALTEMGVSLNNQVNLLKNKFNQDRQEAITLIAGYNFMEYLGAELRASLAVAGEDYGNDKLREYGIYLKPQYPVLNNLNIYGLLGYSSINLSDPSPTQFKGTNAGFSFGGGLDYGVTENISVFTDYVNYLRDFDGSNSTWGANLGIRYNF